MKTKKIRSAGFVAGLLLVGAVLFSGCAPEISVKAQITAEVWGDYANQEQKTGCVLGDKHQCKLATLTGGTK